MTHTDLILEYLGSIKPRSATNSQIRAGTGIRNHSDVYQNTQLLLHRGLIEGRQLDRKWQFSAGPQNVGRPIRTKVAKSKNHSRQRPSSNMSPHEFEAFAKRVMGAHFDCEFREARIPGVHKRFDFVSDDQSVVGDAKYYTLVGGERLPPAKFSIIAEHVWLLEKTKAKHPFLVFGNDRRVPEKWLERYGPLVSGVEFFFIGESGGAEQLM